MGGRGPALLLGHLMKSSKKELKQCFLALHAAKKGVAPNNGFMRQLQKLERDLFGGSSLPVGMFADDWGFGCLELLMMVAEEEEAVRKSMVTI